MSTSTRRRPRCTFEPPAVTALSAGDEGPLVAVHRRMSDRSRRLRYSAPTPRLSPRMLFTLTDLRPGHHEAYVAWRGRCAVGVARWVRIDELPDAAELALEVADDEQGQGLGTLLSVQAARAAVRAGVRTIVVSVDPDNDKVRGWLARLDARTLPDDEDRFVLPANALSGAHFEAGILGRG